MQKLIIFILCLWNLRIFLCSPNYNFELERIEPIKGDQETLVDYSGVRLGRKGRSEKYVANGNLIYTEDLGEDIMHMVKTTYSATGSSQFRSHPYTVQKSSICEFFKTFYREYGQSWVQGHTDFPLIPEEGICPLPKGNYYIKDLLFDEEKLPNHAPRGLWKLEQVFQKKDKIVGGIVMYVKVTDKV